jgi:hypothetical protein
MNWPLDRRGQNRLVAVGWCSTTKDEQTENFNSNRAQPRLSPRTLDFSFSLPTANRFNADFCCAEAPSIGDKDFRGALYVSREHTPLGFIRNGRKWA